MKSGSDITDERVWGIMKPIIIRDRINFLEEEIRRVKRYIHNSEFQPVKAVFDNLDKLEMELSELKMTDEFGNIGQFGVPKNLTKKGTGDLGSLGDWVNLGDFGKTSG